MGTGVYNQASPRAWACLVALLLLLKPLGVLHYSAEWREK